MGGIITVFAVVPALSSGVHTTSAVVTLVISIPIALSFFLLALLFPAMRYEIDQAEVILHYGPLLTYHIPLSKIQTIRKRNLSMTIWSSIRFPGIALFTVPYGEVGNVKMCATAALNGILLIETEKEKFGITPVDEEAFIARLRANMKG